MKAQAIHLRIGRISSDNSQGAALRDGALAPSIEVALAQRFAIASSHQSADIRDISRNSLASMIAGNIADRLAADGMVPGGAQARTKAQRGGGHE